MKLFLLFLAFLIFQRISELLLARKNETAVRKMGALEYDSGGYRTIVLMHAAFFLSLVSEYLLLGRGLNEHWPILVTIFLLTQALRYWSILSLGKFWNTKILVVPGTHAVTSGPYKYLRHPNYLAVVIEIAVVPLIFSCYITSVLFTVLNLIALRRRISIEESALLGGPPGDETSTRP
ncbi:MAG TPA: isoprenylcysteine carboxylmethyltransferase family protein [Thermodesulfobacteriota bacterium]|nr:isoprenylcysteine carboxylmethyltransferase family protein [Thermodesulfobacteriota bacterium]